MGIRNCSKKEKQGSTERLGREKKMEKKEKQKGQEVMAYR